MKPLDKNQAIRQTRRNLPHWEQAGGNSFIPWRLADSVPATKLAEWKQARPRRQAAPPEPR